MRHFLGNYGAKIGCRLSVDLRYTIYDIRCTIYEGRYTRDDLRGTKYRVVDGFRLSGEALFVLSQLNLFPFFQSNRKTKTDGTLDGNTGVSYTDIDGDGGDGCDCWLYKPFGGFVLDTLRVV
jgi:hypothetical protein